MFNDAYESCSKANKVYLESPSNALTLTGDYTGTIGSTDGNAVTSSLSPIVVIADTSGGVISLTVQVQIQPSCYYSPIVSTKSIKGPYAIVQEATYAFVISDSLFKHEHQEFGSG